MCIIGTRIKKMCRQIFGKEILVSDVQHQELYRGVLDQKFQAAAQQGTRLFGAALRLVGQKV